MLFFVHCEDRAGAESVRKENRAAHLEYIAGFDVRFAGPTLDDAGEHMTGSVLVVEAADRAALDAFLEGDPYARAGLFERTTVCRFKQVIPAAG
jgi:uncharacterized protein YciI